MKVNLPDWVFILIALVFLFGLALWSLTETASPIEEETKSTKEDLAKRYTITRPTLKKWIKYFQHELNIDEWTKKRFLTVADIATLEDAFGRNYEGVFNKAKIAELASSDYKTVSENVILNLDKIGISHDAWKSCSCFPPTISARILNVLG